MEKNITKTIIYLIKNESITITSIWKENIDYNHLDRINYNLLKLEEQFLNIVKLIIKITKNYLKDNNDISILKDYLELFKMLQNNTDLVEDQSNYYIIKDTLINLNKTLKCHSNDKIKVLDPNFFDDLINYIKEICNIYKRKKYNDNILFIINFILFIYFKINVYHQINFFIPNNLEELLEISDNKDIIKFNYYYGRYLLMSSQYYLAEEYLNKGFDLLINLSNKDSYKSIIIKILIYLIPLKILKGSKLDEKILTEYNLYFFKKIYNYVKECDLKNYKKMIFKQKNFLLKKGLFFIFEYIELYIIRNLFRYTHKINNNENNLELEVFKNAYNKRFKENSSIEEIDCIFGNLIYKGLIRGKIENESKMCVFPKKNIFPNLLEAFEDEFK